MDFKVGDEAWWFKVKTKSVGFGMGYHSHLTPDELELVHDVVTDIQDDVLICWHGSHSPKDIWGKTRKEAWARLKSSIEKWGPLE